MNMLWLLGGLGMGAGLMYLLDPDQGEERRDIVRGQLAAYGRQTEGLLDDTTRTLGRQAQAVLAKTRVPFQHQSGRGERRLPQTAPQRRPLGLYLLGCAGLGAGLVYLLEPQNGPQRRALLREKARAYWQKTEGLFSSTDDDRAHQTDGRRLEETHTAHHA